MTGRGVSELIEPDSLLGIGGCIATGTPMGLLRELIRVARGPVDLVSSMTGGLGVDVLVAAGLARSVRSPYVGLEGLAPVAPALRRSVIDGVIDWFEFDEGTLACGLEAAARELPFGVWTAALGTSLPELNSDIVAATDEATGRPYLRVRPLRLGTALIWAPAADSVGNLGYVGTTYANELLANAAKTVIAQVDEVVSTRELLANFPTVHPGAADFVAAVPEGPAPSGGHRAGADRAWIRSYVRAVQEGGWEDFLLAEWPTPAGWDGHVRKAGAW